MIPLYFFLATGLGHSVFQAQIENDGVFFRFDGGLENALHGRGIDGFLKKNAGVSQGFEVHGRLVLGIEDRAAFHGGRQLLAQGCEGYFVVVLHGGQLLQQLF
jgi:hypothetical protein